MPVYLNDINDFSELGKFNAVLIVPCRFCPAASMAVKKKKPYFEFMTNLFKTRSYEEYIETVKSKLENMGIKADIFESHLLHQFVVCMWTSRRRNKLKRHARAYDAVAVLGCEAAVDTVYDSIDSTACHVFQGMRTEGIMSIKPIFNMPCNVSLELNRITPLLHQAKSVEPWTRL